MVHQESIEEIFAARRAKQVGERAGVPVYAPEPGNGAVSHAAAVAACEAR